MRFEETEGLRIGCAGIILHEETLEDRSRWGHLGEKRGAGSQLEVVRGSENFIGGFAFDAESGFGAFEQTRSEDGMVKVRIGFIEALD